ncbi:MAG: HupE/UreJ family protein, partial [Deltaproteobacteria bacterium]|nr:HupE/UreJ family protein [Deltaproteobacteria bacterium]
MPIEVAMLATPRVLFPTGSARMGETTRTRAGDMAVEYFRVRIPGGLAGQRLGLHFPDRTGDTEVLIRILNADGRIWTGRLVSAMGRGETDVYWPVPTVPTAGGVARTYLWLGVEHILSGLDHLAFVLALVLLTPAFRHLWKTITAFTAAHSVSLALAALGVVRVPQPPVEAAIALSILFVAREVCLVDHETPSPNSVSVSTSATRRPWIMAFAFGLLHGL